MRLGWSASSARCSERLRADAPAYPNLPRAWHSCRARRVDLSGFRPRGRRCACMTLLERRRHAPGAFEEDLMPEERTKERARKAKAEGKSPSTQAGEFVREEIHHVREGKHGARSAKQAIAIGLSKARRAGGDLPPPKPGTTSARARRSAQPAYERGHGAPARRPASPRRKRAISAALRRDGHRAASHEALARHARSAAASRTASERSAAAKKAARTKGPRARKAAAEKAARTRAAA